MENATKALLIAAAVLIAILIISLGIVVYNKASEAVTGAGDMKEYQIQQFNEKFTKYAGDNVSGSDVNAMLQTVLNHNNAQPDTSTCVSVSGAATVTSSNAITTLPAKVNAGSRYSITVNISPNTKLVNAITVTQLP